MSYCFTKNQWGEKFVDELNRDDFTKTRSTDFFDRTLSFNLQTENTLFVICGSDSGLLLTWLRVQNLGRGSRIAVVEDDTAYQLIAPEYRGLLDNSEACAESKLTSRSYPKISLHKYSQWQKDLFENADNPWLSSGKISVLESHASSVDYARLYMGMHTSLMTVVQERVQQQSHSGNDAVFTDMQFRNMVDNTTPLKISDNFGQGKSAVILGGGPSLDLHLPWVEANRENLFVIAVSRIAGKLIERDLKPDMVVSVDPYDISYEICKEGILWTDIPLVHNYHVSSKLLQQWQAETFCLGNRLPWQSFEQSVENIPATGPTVSHAAVLVAGKLGFSQILMTGIDLCYNAAASSHSFGSPEQMIQSMPSLCNAKVKTYSGRFAGTNITFKNSVQMLETMGQLINKDSQVLFNLSHDAAYCPSIAYIDFNEVLLTSVKPDFNKYAKKLEASDAANDLAWLDSELKTATHHFSKIRAKCKEAKHLVRKICSDSQNPTSKNFSLKLTKLRKSIEEDYPDHFAAILHYKSRDLNKTQGPTDFADMSPAELTDWGQHYYNIIDQGAKDLINFISCHTPRIQLRRDEKADDVDIRAIMKQWRDDNTPGRILKWKTENLSRVRKEDRAWIQRTSGKFKATLTTPAALVSEKLSAPSRDLLQVVKSLVFLRTNSSHDELQAIVSRLDDSVWPYSALKPFTAGLLMELNTQLPEALVQFQLCIDACSIELENETSSIQQLERLLEESLARMTQCYLGTNDRESAIGTLGMLCEIVPMYIVSYAKLLNLSGRSEFAEQLLHSYLDLYPANKKAQNLLDQISSKENEAPALKAEDSPVYKQKITGALQAIMGA